MVSGTALIVTDGHLDHILAKTCHGLLRGSDRFKAIGVIDPAFAGRDAGEVMDGRHLGVTVFSTVEAALAALDTTPDFVVVGVAFPGGKLPPSCHETLVAAINADMGVVCGLHQLLNDDPELVSLAAEKGVRLIDVRKPRSPKDLHFWNGDIYRVRAPRVAVLGTDCALGKRTTCRFLMQALRKAGHKAEMIYTGQTGWMQGYPYGFIFDSTANDFVSGELEYAIVQCDKNSSPDIILLEGQSALRNPSGPCGTEMIISGDARGVILQHAPGRHCYLGLEKIGKKIVPVEEDIALVEMYGAEVLAISLNEEGMTADALKRYQLELQQKTGITVVQPLAEGVDHLLPVVSRYAGL